MAENPTLTLAILKPDALRNNVTDSIIEVIKASGFRIVDQTRVHVSRDRWHLFYKEFERTEGFDAVLDFMASGAVLLLVLSKVNAVEDMLQIAGPPDSNVAREESPNSIRALYGVDSLYNVMDCSSSVPAARREINFFFPNKIVDPLPTEEETQTYLATHVNEVLADALTALCKAKPEDPVKWLGAWLLENNPNQPRIEQEIIEPPTQGH
ncbi:putative nucleoside diphosphate kinase [Paratrimastix pyriformis]|uniref:Nucleoside diphosphate kinase n=1 Tax=Paratrimastix pyriformis TaxID=342808 RepID=A0ABQ8UDL7_9EUKA|nr:putative nucleoside diphosphate kinase [Paratrimastix pyriformis]